MSIEEALESFRHAAIAKGDFAVSTDTDHALHRQMAKSVWALKKHGAAGDAALKSLLADNSPHVRLWAASQLLSEGDTTAAEIIKAEVAAGGLLGFAAKMVLKQWRAGLLRSPFGTA